MPRSRQRRAATFGWLWALPLTAALGAQVEVSTLGRSLFEEGRGRDGRSIIGRVAGGSVPMTGGTVACANCHGQQGSGGSEAWVEAPDIRWFALSKPYGARRAGGQGRPPYDRASLARVLRTGLAPDGVVLDPAMPRFDLADDEIDALLAHLVHLTEEGYQESERPSLVLLMPQAPTPVADRLLRGLQSCQTKSADPQVPQTLPALRVVRYTKLVEVDVELTEMARGGNAVALFAPYLIGVENDYSRSGMRTRLPILLPMAMRSLGNETRTFFAFPGLYAQAQALVASPTNPAENRLRILIDAGTADEQVHALRLQSFAERAGWRVHVHVSTGAASLISDFDALLALADLPTPPETLPTGFRLWVPAAFIVPLQLDAWVRRGAAVRIALPYPPTFGDDAHWIPPADAWVAVGCELMARLPPVPRQRDGVEAWQMMLSSQPELKLGNWVRLPAKSDDRDSAARVFVSDWPQAPAAR